MINFLDRFNAKQAQAALFVTCLVWAIPLFLPSTPKQAVDYSLLQIIIHGVFIIFLFHAKITNGRLVASYSIVKVISSLIGLEWWFWMYNMDFLHSFSKVFTNWSILLFLCDIVGVFLVLVLASSIYFVICVVGLVCSKRVSNVGSKERLLSSSPSCIIEIPADALLKV
jgi:hypothetical protein